jgi:hypothetical protein
VSLGEAQDDERPGRRRIARIWLDWLAPLGRANSVDSLQMQYTDRQARYYLQTMQESKNNTHAVSWHTHGEGV